MRMRGASLRVAWPEVFPEAELLPHLICSRPCSSAGLMMRRTSIAARDELVAAIAGRYAQGDRAERGRPRCQARGACHRPDRSRTAKAGGSRIGGNGASVQFLRLLAL